LISQGHRVIMHIAGPRDWAEAQVRERGWREELVLAGLPIRPPLVGDWSADFGYEAAKRVVATPDCTAVFAANDQMALGLIHGLHDAGVRVPEDVSVVGFDDFAEARHLLPPLTTIRQDFNQLGSAAVAALIDLIEDPQSDNEVQRIEPTLVVRQSTAPPPSAP
ncbi:MAG: substrate-binding domain-containing protein, partial [Mycetocola sp.]